jgi:hypothetical protein
VAAGHRGSIARIAIAEEGRVVRGTRWRSLLNPLRVEVLAATDWCVTFRVVGGDSTKRTRLCRLDRATFERAYEPCPERAAPGLADDGAAEGATTIARGARPPRPSRPSRPAAA